jgi:glycosyltransferase involved in cell wall biosynthesis
MGRPELGRALHQIAAQTYRPLEIVLVDASGEQSSMSNHQ